MQRLILASAIALLSSHAVLAEEVNPFTGAHGKIEDLRLQSDTTAQQNKLILEKIELRKNESTLRELEDGAPTGQDKLPAQLGGLMGTLLGAAAQQVQAAKPPVNTAATEPPKQAPPPPPVAKPQAPRVDMKLSGVIESDGGLTAIITQGDRTWTVMRGDRVGKATVTRIAPEQVTLSNGKRLTLNEGEFTVANGELSLASAKPRLGGGSTSFPALPAGEEMKAIMNITQPPGGTVPTQGAAIQSGPPPAPATFQ